VAPQIIKAELLDVISDNFSEAKLLIWNNEICAQFSKSMQYLLSLNMQIRSCLFDCLCNDITWTISCIHVFLPQLSPGGLSDRLQFGDPKAVGNGRGSER